MAKTTFSAAGRDGGEGGSKGREVIAEKQNIITTETERLRYTPVKTKNSGKNY